MHPVDKAFYDLTVKQRDLAWRENERLQASLDHYREALAAIATTSDGREHMRQVARAALASYPRGQE